MKFCELCKGLARAYCESDQASLCWNCDVKVHGANFLVARHSRTVLCHACQSPTPWKATGAELGVTVSVCESCVVGGRNRGRRDDDDDVEESQGGNDDEIDSNDGDLDEEEEDRIGENRDDDEEEEEVVGGDDEDGDTQVVPWSAATPLTTPPPAASSSSSEDSVLSRFGNGGGEASEASSLKKFREISSDLTSQDGLDLSSRKRKYLSAATSPAIWSGSDAGDASGESKLSKSFKTESEFRPGQDQTESVIESLRKFRRQNPRNLSG